MACLLAIAIALSQVCGCKRMENVLQKVKDVMVRVRLRERARGRVWLGLGLGRGRE